MYQDHKSTFIIPTNIPLSQLSFMRTFPDGTILERVENSKIPNQETVEIIKIVVGMNRKQF